MLLPWGMPALALDVPPVIAAAESSLKTADGQVRQLAFDGDPATSFAAEKAGPADHFTLVLDSPVGVKSIAVSTGRPDGSDKLDAGVLEVSTDGKAFEEAAKFSDGKARAELAGRPIKAVRIKPTEEMKHPLAIAEIAIESDPPIATFRYPVEFIVDVADAPEMKEWAEKAARECERWYPRLNDELKSEGYKPARVIYMSLKANYNGVAATSGNRITGSVKFFKDHPDDVGAMVHETVHVIQHYRGRGNPGWLVEGLDDYIRFFKYEPGKIGPINARRARYNASYRTTAAFLAYVTDKYNKELISKLNTAMREGKYKEEIFKELTGKTVQELDEEWRATLK